MAEQRRQMMIEQLRNALPKPNSGEKQVFGFFDKGDCTTKAQYFIFHSGTMPPIRLLIDPKAPPQLIYATPDLSGTEIGCTTKAIEFPVVFVYKDAADKKLKSDGVLVSATFVPRSFTMGP